MRTALLIFAVCLLGPVVACQSSGSSNTERGSSPAAADETAGVPEVPASDGDAGDPRPIGSQTGADPSSPPQPDDPPTEDPAAGTDDGEMGEIEIDGAYIEVEGLQMRDMACEFGEGADAFAMVEVVALVSDAKAALDACAPDGAAVRIAFDWRGDGAPRVVESSAPSSNACVEAAFHELGRPMQASCTAIVVIGDAEGAAKAADAMYPLEEEQAP